jgi:CHAT domain-containing protein
VAYTPSASTAGALRARGSGRAAASKGLFALADPALEGAGAAGAERGFEFTALPHARAEVSAIGRLFPAGASRVLTGAEAAEDRLKREDLSAYRYLHFAAHGYFDEAEPGRSGLVLARGGEDGFLQAREVARLKLSSDLVTLSACQSGLGRLLAGEGVQGLARAFLHAGSRAVVVSLWNVNDEATAELMRRFYGHLQKGLARDEALREAKRSLAAPGGRWRHPYYWAAFVLQGE